MIPTTTRRGGFAGSSVVPVFAAFACLVGSSARAEEGAPNEALLEELAPLGELDLVELMEPETKVVTASKVARDLRDAPASIEAIDADQIRARGYRTVAEVLQQTLGFYVLDDQILPNVSVRGVAGGLMSESGLIKVMIDGKPVAFRTTAGHWLGTELIPMQLVERIEIVRGPASALYGADAFLGVVNVITKDGGDLAGASGQLDATTNGVGGGGHLGYRVDAASGYRFGALELVVGAAAEGLDHSGLSLPSSSPAPRIPGDLAVDPSTADPTRRSLTGFARASFDLIPDRLSVRGSLSASRIRRPGEFAQWAQLTNADDIPGGTLVALQQIRATLGLDWNATDTVSVRLTGMYSSGGPQEEDQIEVGSDFFFVERPFGYRALDLTGEAVWQATRELTVVGGVELSHDDETLPVATRIDKATGEAFGSEAPVATPSVVLANQGLYVQGEWRILPDRVGLTGGLRYDHHSIYGGRLTGRAGIVSHWTRALTTKLLYGSAFKAPSPMLLFAEPLRPGDVVGNPLLEPQMIHAAELQAMWAVHRTTSLRSGVAYSLILDKAEFRPKGINVAAQNVSEQRVLSWESEISFRYRDAFRAHASIDLQLGTRDLGEEGYEAQLIGSDNVVHPSWIVRTGARWHFPAVPVELSVLAMVVSERRASDTNLYENGADYRLPAYVRVDAALHTDEVDILGLGAMRLSLCAYNLLNSRAPDPGFAGIDYPRLPIEIVLRLAHRF